MRVYRWDCEWAEPTEPQDCYREITADDVPILHLDEDGDFRISWRDDPGEKNVIWSGWTEAIGAGQFYVIPVSGSIQTPPGFFTGTGS